MKSNYGWPEGHVAATVLTFDLDGESGVLSDVPDAARRLSVMTHQAYGPQVGLPRILRLLEIYDFCATFFVPGFTAERHPEAVRSIVDAGHEVAHHGYLHESVTELSAEQEEEVLLLGLEVLGEVTGERPIGWRGPMWEVGHRTPALLAKHGFRYDSSLMDEDRPYRLRTGPDEDAPTLVEIPVHWGIDDGEQYAWLPGIWEAATISSPRKVLELWTLEFDAVVREGGCFVPTIHPYLSGRPARAAALESLLQHIRSTERVWVAPACEVAAHVGGLELPSTYHEPFDVGQVDGRTELSST